MPATSRETLIREADAFLQAFATEKALSISASEMRRSNVEKEIAATGSWAPTYDELEHGARMAWRNNARCIGRLFWPSLRIRDLRHLAEPEDIHRELLEHIALATNSGKIQPLITVFEPSSRIWNHQLFGYACYEQADGTTLGDPKNLAFTREAQALGWSGNGTAFDLLPLVIQKAGSPPVLFPPPLEVLLEVQLTHPALPWFSNLGLKWYAVPILSDMRLRIGGIDFCAAPFNGWYMGTEIGSRDLGDTSRYNMLPVIAERMDLDMTDSSSLWRDRALVELNAAVLHSYETAGVRIVDHHRASSEFMEFTAREQKAGRAVSADWKWIVPPLSGSATPVFHTLWKNFEQLPDYLPQPKAWLES
jgi:nitric-oxide synthase, bacterial